MNRNFKRTPPTPPEASGRERRRIGTIVHDERGNASVDWRDAPADEERQVLEILGEPKLSIKTEEETFDPYARRQARDPKARDARSRGTRTDLRKLSEWIKMMRELEARKRDDGGDGGDEPQ